MRKNDSFILFVYWPVPFSFIVSTAFMTLGLRWANELAYHKLTRLIGSLLITRSTFKIKPRLIALGSDRGLKKHNRLNFNACCCRKRIYLLLTRVSVGVAALKQWLGRCRSIKGHCNRLEVNPLGANPLNDILIAFLFILWNFNGPLSFYLHTGLSTLDPHAIAGYDIICQKLCPICHFGATKL